MSKPKTTDRKFGFKVIVRCYHPEDHDAYECKTIEDDASGSEYQGFVCPKCSHEIGLVVEQYYFVEDEKK